MTGYVIEDQFHQPGGGGAISLAIPFARERWEFEAVGGLVKLHARDPVFLVDIGIKRSFELFGSVSPHVAFGPALSVASGRETRVTAGALVGVGVKWFPRPQLGLLADLMYRLLGGAEGLEHVLSLSVGIGIGL
ncbi:MAG TPA: hypothetical protein VI299_27905 [Polyangiales bacterium]